MNLVVLFSRNKTDFLCGSRHNIVLKDIDLLFKNLSVVADLIFFEDGPVEDEKIEIRNSVRDERYSDMINILQHIYEGTPIRQISNNGNERGKELPRASCMVDAIHAKAKQYGQIILTGKKGCDAEIVHYANNHQNVLAILGNDSDFLIFPGKWRYFSVRELNITSLKTMEYDREVLRNHLDLSNEELYILSTLAGNYWIPYDNVRPIHGELFGHDADQKFPAIANYIKKNLKINFRQLIKTIADILQDTRSQTIHSIKKSLVQYNTEYLAQYYNKKTDPLSPLLDFCLTNHIKFVYQVLIDFPRRIIVDYYDMQRTDFPDYNKILLDLSLRQIGVVVKNKKKTCFGTYRHKIICKQSHEDGYEMIFVEPIYPLCPIPELLQLLNRNEFPQHDNVRLELLKWMVADEKLRDVDILSIPQQYLLDVLVLVHLTQNGFITIREADMILFTIMQVERAMIPDELEPPEQLNDRAFIISFLYSKTHRIIASCFKIVGFTDYLVRRFVVSLVMV